jgi:magnesium-transporting ATPase (P-type)
MERKRLTSEHDLARDRKVDLMNKERFLPIVYIALLWSLILDIGATLNVSSFLHSVAGGQYTSLPTFLRFAYAIQTLLVIFQIIFITQLYRRNGAWSKASYLLARIFLVLAALSTIVNSLSKSPGERWNAIAAAIIAYGFYVLGDINSRPIK